MADSLFTTSIRSTQHIEADYVKVHFSLENYENIGNKKIYVVGNFNNYLTNVASENEIQCRQGYL